MKKWLRLAEANVSRVSVSDSMDEKIHDEIRRKTHGEELWRSETRSKSWNGPIFEYYSWPL